ncbi:mechanosensitive ion channel domain-containing protein [Rariglobus hedericola]|uniref:Mechanosensitive ion channel n=1 Tax=Rariglobus hedericola TaxID=2597822 RepID=A0A556QMD8_9BACT|nr:mechanosensitive ion channel domain-containing protein [Rariglobus hedericola]TSJ77820.1 mechanosensitive ion channel [Rariglobus hedericola]
MSTHSFLRASIYFFAAIGISLAQLPLLAALPTDALTGKNPAPAQASEAELTPTLVTERRASLQKEIDRTRVDFEKLPANQAEDSTLWLTQEIVLLGRIDSTYTEQLHTLQHAADLAKESAELTDLAQNPRPPEVRLKPPQGLVLLDQLYDQRDYLLHAKAALKTDIENVATSLQDARDDLEAKDRLRRTAKESAQESANRIATQGALRLAELESRLARETIVLHEKSLATLKFQQSLLAPKIALLLPDLEWLHAHLVIGESDLVAAQAKQDKRIAELDLEIAKTRELSEQVARLVVTAERRDSAATKSPETDAELESRRADRQTVNLMLSALTAQRERQATLTDVLRKRILVLTDAGSSADFKTTAKANDEALARIPKERRPLFAELRKNRQELQALQARLADSSLPARQQDWVSDRVKHLTAGVAINERNLADLTELATARNRLNEELGARVSTFSWGETFTSAQSGIAAGWNYEVFSIADQPIRVNTILTVIVLIIAGHWFSRRTSTLIGSAVFKRFGMNTGRRAAWQTLSFYALFLIVLLTATNLFHLSLTQFSVVSGALAVGIGFGSQNLISNFISGIILLVERPINQGDVLEINGQQVTVETIGPRSTLVRSRDNTHVIVPNSRLLEENVVNLTLSDDVIRTRIRVSVAYGSPTREVERLLEEVMTGLEGAMKEPAPFATFTDFGDSALAFEASFWSALEGRKDIESEMRHRIAEVFTKAGIVMAFPQRDVHLETTKPLQVEILASASPAAPPKA